MNKNNTIKNAFPYLILMVIICGTLFFLNLQKYEVHELTTGEVINKLEEEKVTEITITPSSNDSVYYVEGK